MLKKLIKRIIFPTNFCLHNVQAQHRKDHEFYPGYLLPSHFYYYVYEANIFTLAAWQNAVVIKSRSYCGTKDMKTNLSLNSTLQKKTYLKRKTLLSCYILLRKDFRYPKMENLSVL